MISSDSQPIQFWADDVETFNEKEVCGIIKQDCFCQIFQTDDQIVIQINDFGDEDSELIVKAYNDDDEAVGSITMENGNGYQQASFLPSEIGMVAGSKYVLKIEQALRMPAAVGSFILTGNDANLLQDNEYAIQAETGAFALTGIDVTLVRPERYQISMFVQTNDSTKGYSSAFTGTIDSETLNVPAPANGGSDSDSIASQAGSQSVDISAQKDSGTAVESGTIIFKKNGSIVDTVGFSIGNPVTGSTTVTGVMPGDDLSVEITEL